MYEDIIHMNSTTPIIHMNSTTPCRPSDIISFMKRKHAIDVSYDKVWRTREVALNLMRGSPKSSYSLLPAFSNALIENNPGKFYSIITVPLNHYHTV